MTSFLSDRLKRVKTSPTLAITARAKAMRAEGQEVITMSAGEPDFATPSHICDAAKQAIDDGFTRYTAVDGLPELKQAIINKLARENQLDYTHNQILVSTGAKQCLFNLFQALLNPGDEVIIPSPYWVSYPDMAYIAGASVKTINTGIENNFKVTPQALQEAITPQSKLLIINSPSNPTGIAYTQTELSELAKVIKKYPNLFVVSDDIYEYIWWHAEPFTNILSADSELVDRTIVVNGVSKSYAMTGWRIGYAAGPEPIISAMKKIQSQSTSNPNAVAQKAAQAAIEGPQECVEKMCQSFKERHDLVFNELNNIAGIKALPSDGTFYIFPNITGAMANHHIKTDVEFAEKLLQTQGIAVVPGTAFGAPGYLRISFANSPVELKAAVEKIRAFCA